MVSQKVCIIGGSLTGLVTAIALSKLNCDIDLITDNTYKNTKNNRTIAISENNLNFLKKLNISKNLNNEAWPCSVMKLYSGSKSQKFSEIFHNGVKLMLLINVSTHSTNKGRIKLRLFGLL